MSIPTHQPTLANFSQSVDGPANHPSLLSGSLAEYSIAKDIENDPDDTDEPGSGEDDIAPLSRSNTLSSSYRRPSRIATGGTRSTIVPVLSTSGYLTRREQEAVREEERSLLRDNNIILPKHPRRTSVASIGNNGILPRLLRRGSSRARSDIETTDADRENEEAVADEHTALISGAGVDPSLPYGGQDSAEEIDQKWDSAVEAGMIQTTWGRELKVLGKYSAPLVVTGVLQYSLVTVSVFTVGHIGKIELAAVTLGSMTASITGYSVIAGLTTSLDTLCAQAYGSGRKKLVGLQLQRVVFFVWLCLIPISAIWLAGTQILSAIVPEKEVAVLAGLYLKITLAGLFGYSAFEAGKRYVQAQGLFNANFYVLIVVAPLNVFLHWLFVWHLKWGFVGAPIAVAITENCLPLGLFLYVYFVAGRECWGGFTKAAFTNWMPMIKLALPGLLMTVAEFIAFEMLTLTSSFLGAAELAAQGVLTTICVLAYQIPFPIAVAASTRIANLIGATLAGPARLAAKVALVVGFCVGATNMIVLSALRGILPVLFSNEEEVKALVSTVIPLCAAFQTFDALAGICGGILRGIGRQEIGGYVNLLCFYGVGVPISFGTCFGLGWGLLGLWAGPAVGLGLVALIEGCFIFQTSWERSVEDAKLRNAAG